MKTRRDTRVQRTLRAIERAVLNEVTISPAWRRAATVAAPTLAVAAVIRWWSIGVYHPGVHGAVGVDVSTVIFLVAMLMSLTAVRTAQFRWCFAAAFTSGIATVTGAGAVWWHQTTAAAGSMVWAVISAVSAAVLTACWLAVALTPLDRSQPDMRAHQIASR
ncbi:hypothetical protein ABQE57_10205 [Mycolicibacterium elephantis]